MTGSLRLLGVIGALSGCGLVGGTQPKLRTAVDARSERLTTCYRELIRRQPDASGSMRLKLTVRHEQPRVTDVEVGPTDLEDRRFISCVTRVLRGIVLTESPTSSLAVQYIFTFDQTEPGQTEP